MGKAQMSIGCDSAMYAAFQPYVVVMIVVYPIGIPLTYLWLLWRHRKNLKQRESVRDTDESIQGISFLWSQYTPKAWWFEMVEMPRKLILTSVLMVMVSSDIVQTVIGLFVCMLYWVLCAHVKPFSSSQDYYLTIGSQFILFV